MTGNVYLIITFGGGEANVAVSLANYGVVTSKSLNEDDLIKTAIARRTDLSAVTLKASIDILRQIAIEKICNGASVAFGPDYFGLKVNGVFTGDNAQWDSSKHSLAVRAVPNAELRKAVESTTVNVRGLASSGTVVNSVTDVASGEENSKLTPGGGVNVNGTRIRIEGGDTVYKDVIRWCERFVRDTVYHERTDSIPVIVEKEVPVNYLTQWQQIRLRILNVLTRITVDLSGLQAGKEEVITARAIESVTS